MKHPARATRKSLHKGQGVFQRITLMDHTVQSKFRGDLKLLLENLRLLALIALVVFRRAGPPDSRVTGFRAGAAFCSDGMAVFRTAGSLFRGGGVS